MASSRTFAFVKFFKEEKHVDDLVAGKLFMRKISYFQRVENPHEDDGRPDPGEAIESLRQPDRTKLTLNFQGVGTLTLRREHLVGPVSITRDFYSDMHVFCMTALSIPDSSTIPGGHNEIQAHFRAACQVYHRTYAFRPHAVIVDTALFLSKLNQALEKTKYWTKKAL